MKDTEKTLVIVPAYNEEKGISGVLQGVKKVAPDLRVVVINDASTDTTCTVARAAGAEVLHLPFHMGYGVALQTGYKYALHHEYDYVIQLDGDGQHDPGSIADLLAELNKGEAELIIGSRFLRGKTYRIPILRRLGMLLFGSVASLLMGQRITDPTSGYRAMHKNALRLLVRDLYPEDYPDADTIVMLHRFGLRIQEIPVTMYPNVKDQTMHSGLKPFYYVFKMALSIVLTLLRREVSWGLDSRDDMEA